MPRRDEFFGGDGEALQVKIAVFSRLRPWATGQPEAQWERCAAEARRRGHEIRAADVAAFVTGQVEVVVGHSIYVGGVRVDDVDAVILGPLPGPAALTSPPGQTLSSEVHAELTTAQYARHVLAWSIVIDLEARGVPVLSSPTRARPFDFKPTQLMALRRAGLPVPPTRIGSSDVDDAAAAIDKAVSGGPVHSAHAHHGLVIRQPRLRGVDLRAVVVGNQVVAQGRFPGDDDVIDLRLRPSFIDGSARWQRDDDPVVAAFALRATAVCQCDFAAVDLKRTADGVIVLEVNRTPVVVDIEDDLEVPITSAFIDLVEKRAREK